MITQIEALMNAVQWIEEHPDLEIYDIRLTENPITLVIFNMNSKLEAQEFVHAVGKVTKTVDSDFLRLTHTPLSKGFCVQAVFNRSTTCTSRVVGTRTVIKTVPISFEEQTVEEDIVEWDCGSIMKEENE